MIIWTIALSLLALLGLIGFFQGAIRTTIVLIGIGVALSTAGALAPTVEPWMASLGVENPILGSYLAPVLAFVLVDIVFQILAEIAHWRVAKYYRYKTDDVDRMRWQRMNRKVGLTVGGLTGALYAFLICIVIYPMGYLTIQIPAGEQSSKTVQYINDARRAMPGTGLDKLVAHFDPTPAKYYNVVDLLGLLYHNPDLHKRVLGYPDFLNIQENPNVQAYLNDEEIQRQTQGQGSVSEIINNPTFLALIADEAFMGLLRQVDPADLIAFLKTGESPKYKDERILGRWQIDPFAIVKETIEQNPDIKSSELVQAKKLISAFRDEVTFTATPDNSVVVKLEAKDFAQNFQKEFGVNLAALPKDPKSIQQMFSGEFEIAPPPPANSQNNNNNGFNNNQGFPPPQGPQRGGIIGGTRGRMEERYGVTTQTPQYQQQPTPDASFNVGGGVDEFGAENGGAPTVSGDIPEEVVIARGVWSPRTMDGVSYYFKVQDFILPILGGEEMILSIIVNSSEELMIKIPALQTEIMFEKAF
jgi:uncharacterized membrane protein required for colicin V production